MTEPVSRTQRLRFFLVTGGLYIGTLSLIGYMGLSAYIPRTSSSVTPTVTVTAPKEATKPAFIVQSGQPIRLIIATAGIDLPIDEGYYDPSRDSWTLSDTRLQHAMITMPANNHSGNTFIYGHGTDQVLGPLAKRPLAVGTIAEVHTDNGRVFTYIFQSSHNFTPEDTDIFSYSGPPILTVQTCTGSASEWRTMYTFSFQKVT